MTDFNIVKKSGLCQIQGEMTIYQAAEMREKLHQGFLKCAQMEVDLSEVDEIDSSGMQLLLALKRAGKEADKSLKYVNHSPAVVELIELFGLAEYFGDPMLLPSEDKAASA